MKALRNCLSKLSNAQSKYEGVVGSVEQLIQPFADFPTHILYQNSDGWVVLDDEANNAPLRFCLDLIEEKGVFLHSDYRRICI